MSFEHWEDVREEVRTYLSIGRENGESELETMTRLVWLERHKSGNLHAALEAIEGFVNAALEGDESAAAKNSNVLEWKPALRSARLPVHVILTSSSSMGYGTE
jgi:hypothetical protein